MSDILQEIIKKDDFVMPEDMAANLNNFVGNLKVKKKSKIKNALTAASLCLAVLTASTAGAYALGYNIPVLDRMLNLYNSSPNIMDYAVDQNLSVTDNGITVTINKTIYDENNLTVYATIKGSNLSDKVGTLTLGGSGTIGGTEFLFTSSTADGEYVDNDTYAVVFSHNIENPLPDQLKMDYEVYINNKTNDGYAGEWRFKLDLDKTKLSKKSSTFTPNTVVDLMGGKAKISRITFSLSKVSMNLTGIDGEKTPAIFADDEGYLMYDQNNKEITLLYKSFADGSDRAFTGLFEYYRPENVPTSIKLVPYKKLTPDSLKDHFLTASLDGSLPITLKLSTGSSMTIKDVQKKPEGVEISYSIDLVSPDTEIIPSVKNSKGEEIQAIGGKVEKMANNKIEGTAILPTLAEGDNYTIIIPDNYTYEIYTDKALTIPLSK